MVRHAMEQGEGLQVELKASVPSPLDLGRLVSAFANASGGLIIVGVRKFPFGAVGVAWQRLKSAFDQVNMVHPETAYLESRR